MHDVEVLRYTAFTTCADGGNPAGVVLLDAALDDARMQAIAAEVGYSETAFLQSGGPDRHAVRYFSPVAEVPFCGHATVAAAVALAERGRAGRQVFATQAGDVPVETWRDPDGWQARLTSVAPRVEAAPDALLHAALDALGWQADELDEALPPRVAYAGARHLVLAAATRERLARLDYEFETLRVLMQAHALTTVALLWRESASCLHARNPFPVGGVVEDPATGAAAAAVGGYLRTLGQVAPPARVVIHQGEDMGRPSRLTVDIGEAAGIGVSGHAVALPVSASVAA